MAFTHATTWAGRPVADCVEHAVPRGRLVTTGVILKTASQDLAGVTCCQCVIDDGTGEVDLLFLGRRALAGIEPGYFCHVEGTAQMHHGRLCMWNPVYEIDFFV